MKKIISLIILLLFVFNASPVYAIEIPDDAIGVINIPCLDIKQPFYATKYNDHEHRQAIIDNEYSALYTNWQTAYQILDHLFSTDKDEKGEWNIQQIFSGAYAYVYTHNSKFLYECYLTGKTEYDGNEYINNRLVTPCSSYDIMVACCAEDTEHHFIAVFRRLKEF